MRIKSKTIPFIGLVFLALLAVSCGAEYWQVAKTSNLSGGAADSSLMMGFATPDVGLALSRNNLIISENGGAAWRIAKGVTLPCIMGIDAVDDHTIVADCTCANAQMSADRGATWTDLGFERCSVLSFKSPTAGWASNKSNLISWDGKRAATVSLPKDFNSVSSLAAVSPEQAYLMDREGHIAYTQDRGIGWKTLDAGITKERYIIDSRCLGMRFADAAHGLIVGFDFIAKEWKGFSTADGGRTWKPRTVSRAKGGLCFISNDLSLVTIFEQATGTLVLVKAHPETES